MNIGILGTGSVGETLGTSLVHAGHTVKMGSRTGHSEAASKWVTASGALASQGTFAEAAAFGEVVLDCTNGAHSIDALRMAGAAALGGKILIQVSNPLDGATGFPPTMTVCNTDSLGEQTQREFPNARVVKALNTVNVGVMINPGILAGESHLFICGNDAGAKSKVTALLGEWFGWKPESIIDVGDITCARGTEMYLALWLRLMVKFGTPLFNVQIVRERKG